MTLKAQEQVRDWSKRGRRRRLIWTGVLAGNAALLVQQLVQALGDQPAPRWTAYWLLVTVTLTGCSLWVRRAEARREAWGDKAVAYWLWHWFTGAPLQLADAPDVPWWRDLWANRPWLDTDKAEPCPVVELEDGDPDVPTSPEVADYAAQVRQAQLWARRRCLARRTVTGAARTLATCGLILAEYVRSGSPHGLGPRALLSWGLGGTVALALYGLTLAFLTMRAAMGKWWVHPLAQALAQYADWPLDKRSRSWVKLSRLWENGQRRRFWHAGRLWDTRQRGVEILLSPTYKFGNKHTLEETLAQTYAKSGLSPADVDPVWDKVGEQRSLRLVPAKRLPDKVSFADETPRRWWLEKATVNAPVFAAGKGWRRVQKSLAKDSPHVCVTGPTGSGKTELVHSALCGLLWKNRKVKGTRAEIWDIKVKSHTDLERLGCVDYYRALRDIAGRCIAVATLARDRGAKDVAAEHAGQPITFPPLYVVFEDTAQAVGQMHARRSERLWPEMGKDSPTFGDGLLAWDEILGLGRGVNIHAFACPHRPTVRALGGDVARDNFELVFLMTGHNAGSLRLVDQTLKYEPLPWIPGRARLVHGTHDEVVQAMWDEHREMVPMLAEWYGWKEGLEAPGRHQQTSQGNGHPPDGQASHGQQGDDAEAGEEATVLPGESHGSPAGHVVGMDPVGTRGHLGGQGQTASHMPLMDGVTEGEFTGPPEAGVPAGAQAVGHVGSSLVTPSHQGQEPANNGGVGGGAHRDILTRVSMVEQGEIPGGGRWREGWRDGKSVPGGPVAPQGRHPSGTATGGSPHPRSRATSHEGPGVMGPENAAAPPSNRTVAPQTHPLSLSRRSVPGGEGEGMAGGGARGREDGPSASEPSKVTLSEAWEDGKIGVGVQFDTVKRARTRTREHVRQFVQLALDDGRTAADGVEDAERAGWWFPEVIDTRPAKGNTVEEVYLEDGVVRWWNGRVRAAPEDGEWWVYWLVEGGVGAVARYVAVKIGYTDDLLVRCRAFGKHYPGTDRVGGDIVHLERYPTKAKARAREQQLHRVYKRCYRDVRPGVQPGTTLQCWPHGGGGRGGRETFYMEAELAEDMARHCPSRRAALMRREAA